MIKQTDTGLNSRSKANPFSKEGFLPLITAPMYSVVDESNYQIFLDNKIQVCLPRKCSALMKHLNNTFLSMSLLEFIEFSNTTDYISERICIDTANGNIPELHKAIRKAKEIHGDNLIIMAGNVASVEAFIELAKTGVDYIRVGIGGGGGCNTTSNTGVGQEDLEQLVYQCKNIINQFKNASFYSTEDKRFANLTNTVCNITEERMKLNRKYSKVKIVADGISSYIKQCETKYGFNDNGYAAINKLLLAGADLVMIGKLFAQCLESAGEKSGCPLSSKEYEDYILLKCQLKDFARSYGINRISVKYSGMSTQQEQEKYRTGNLIHGSSEEGKAGIYKMNIKPSEGSVNWIPVRWTLNEWLNGSENQDSYPYLMGWVNSIKSAMAYTGKTKLHNN